MTEEAKAIVSFGRLKRGDRIQVDIHDPQVAGLIKAGYLTVNWRDRGSVDRPDDSGRAEHVSAGGVDSSDPRGQEEEVDGPGEHRSGEEGGDSH